jgi:hypothetical protein
MRRKLATFRRAVVFARVGHRQWGVSSEAAARARGCLARHQGCASQVVSAPMG